MQDLDLESHGLKVLPVDPERIHPFPDGRAVRVWNEDAQVAEEIARISPPDADAYLKWVDFWVRAARIIHPYMLTAPPTLAEIMASVQGTNDEAVLERILFGSAYDMLDQFFESEQVKALFAWSFNDAPLFFARLETSRFGDPRYQGILQGGMGSLPRSIEQAARSYGAQFETNAEVRRVLIENGSAIGVELIDGRQIRAGTVVSNLDPKRSLLDIVDEGHLPSDFRARIRSLKNMRASMKLHASLSEPPDLSHYFGGDWDLGYLGRVRMCPSLDHVRAGRADADAGRLPHHPSMIMQIPSVYDPSMAPEGKHCMSVWVETAAFELADGSWDDAREQVADLIVDALSVYAPNIKDAIIDRQVVTPLGPGTRGRAHQRRHPPPGYDPSAVLRLPASPRLEQLPYPNRKLLSLRSRDPSGRLRVRGPGPQRRPCHPPRHGARFLTTPHHPSDPEPFTAESIRHNLNTSFMGRDLLFYDTLPTTMDVADMKAMAGASEGTVILADDQTAGRGRFDRKWVVEKGAAIAVSIILRPPPPVSARLHIVCSLAVARAAETAAGLKPAIKWPNDVLLDGKKTSGILLTSNRDRDGKLYVNAGIGINVNQTAESLSEITPPATSLRVQAGQPVSRLEVFCALLHHLEKLYLEAVSGSDLLDVWRSYLVTLGQHVRVQWRREDMLGFVEEGRAEDIDEFGRLLLRTAEGELKTLVSGEVTLHVQ